MSVYNDAVSECSCHRTNDSGQPKAFLIKMSEVGQLIAANIDGLDGIRVYTGQDASGKKTAYFVGAVKTGENDAFGNPIYNDVNITTLVKGRPCPNWCSGTNALNS